MGLSANVKLVSANMRDKNPHFLFMTERNPSKEKVLVKIIGQKDDVSLEQEFTAFQLMNVAKPSQGGFRYPKVYGYDPAVPMVIMDYLSS